MTTIEGDVVRVGQLSFRTGNRSVGDDHGPVLEVYGGRSAVGQADDWIEIIRYDCFLGDPHRHFFASDGREEKNGLGTATLEESVCVSVDELRNSLPSILTRLGYSDLATVAGPELRPALNEVEVRLRKLAQPVG